MVFPYLRTALGAGLLWAAAGASLAQDIELAPAVPGAAIQSPPATTTPKLTSPPDVAPGTANPQATSPLGAGQVEEAPAVPALPGKSATTIIPSVPTMQAGTSPSTTSAMTWIPSHHWTPNGGAPGGDMVNGPRVGQPYLWNAPGSPSVGADGGTFGWNGSGWNGYGWGDPYAYHFGPGYHRNANYGHYRFPYQSYRAPWYFKGAPSYNRDTNYPW